MQVLGALSAVASTSRSPSSPGATGAPQAARWGTLWFGLGSATLLFTNRIPFALGTAFGLAAALALQRDRRVLAPVLAVLSAISSPVAGLFVAMGGVAYALAARGEGVPIKRRDGLALAAGRADPAGAAHASPSPRAAMPRSRSPRTCRSRCSPSPRWWCFHAASARCGSAPFSTRWAPRSRWWWTPRWAATPCGWRAARGPVMACALAARGIVRPVVPLVALLVALGFWQWSAGGARHLQGRHRPGGAGVVLRSRARIPAPAARPAARGDPVHARPLGGRRGGGRGPAGPRLASPARHRAGTRSSTRAG